MLMRCEASRARRSAATSSPVVTRPRSRSREDPPRSGSRGGSLDLKESLQEAMLLEGGSDLHFVDAWQPKQELDVCHLLERAARIVLHRQDLHGSEVLRARDAECAARQKLDAARVAEQPLGGPL